MYINKVKTLKTIFLFLIVLITCDNLYSQNFDLGEINDAEYKIYIPDNWNGGLVMYAHGYEAVGEDIGEFEKEVDEFMEIFTSRGFAYAASAYKKQGLVIKDGIQDTEALRTYFGLKYGKPEMCIITGHSMGGIISLATIEKYPAEYNGALPLCGWLAPVHSLLKRTLDMLVIYDFLFAENNGKIVTGDNIIGEEAIRKNVDSKPELAALYAEHFTLKAEQLAEIIVFYQSVLIETKDWVGGMPIGNQETIYSGFGFIDDSLNMKVRRYTAEQETREYFIQYYTPTGQILDPVIALHTTYDGILPVNNYKYYEAATKIKHTNDLYSQNYIMRDGHCNFTIEEISDSFDQLIDWIKEGEKPD